MPEQNIVDAFILFKEQESIVEKIVHELEARGVSTHFWRRDVPFGDDVNALETERLKAARTVLVFLGDSGWGPNHLGLTKEAQTLGKRIIPVLIGDPPQSAFTEADGLFRDRRYLELRDPTDAAVLTQLADEILERRGPAPTALFDRIVSVLVDGNEEQRAGVLRQIRISTALDRLALAARLRIEIQDRFGPGSERDFHSAIRDPKKTSSIRSWMLSCLIWADAESVESSQLILRHVGISFEPDRNVRYWTLAGLYQRQVSYLRDAVEFCISDDAPEVAALARAIASPTDPQVIEEFRSDLNSDNFETAWRVLRLLRVVPIPELVGDVSAQLDRSAVGSARAYDALYALANPIMAGAAVPVLAERPGVEGVVARVITEGRGSDENAIRNFTGLLTAFDPTLVDAAVEQASRNPETSHVAHLVRRFLAEFRRPEVANELYVPGYASDTIDVEKDPLDIREDVQALTAIMLAKEAKPPLAIGLFGNWGSGKSYFMRSMQAAAKKLAARAKGDPASPFCSSIVSIEFNAWHYIDTNLWASLVSYILERLAAHVTPQPTAEEQQAALIKELSSTQAIITEAKEEKKLADKLITDRQDELRNLQLEREQKEVCLRDLRVSDLKTLLSDNEKLKQELNQSLEELGVPAAVNSFSDLSQVVSEAYTVKGRLTALFLALMKGTNILLLVALILFVMVAGPVLVYLLREKVQVSDLFARTAALVAQVTAFISGAAVVLRQALGYVKATLERVETAKKSVDELLSNKRQNPSQAERELQKEIATLNAKEQEAASRLSAATARGLELEERIRAIEEGRSLARFLAERTRSEDYRRHLGLISTIRQDFDSLNDRLTGAAANSEKNLQPVDRIILYIDDLDRCPADKVMEVLQAVHLLLAYPLFVVVVGVDPRWLLHSLSETYQAFQSGGARFSTRPDLWRTTPQNYLEKIFQIPFSLRPMTDTGYSKLITSLLSPQPLPQQQASTPKQSSPQPTLPPPDDAPGGSSPAPDPTSPPVSPSAPGDTPGKKPQKPRVNETEFVINKESLTIKPWETKFAEDLFELIPSPRAAKRFSNIYRILKAPIRHERLPQFEGTEEMPGDFQVPMLLLAILIYAPTLAAALFPKLQQHAASGGDVIVALQQFKKLGFDEPELKKLGLNEPAFKALQDKIRPIITNDSFPKVKELFLEWIPRVSRFSFEVGRAVQPVATRR